MKEKLLVRDFDLGFSGNLEDVVMYVIQLLGNCVIIIYISRNDEFFIIFSIIVFLVFEFNFYSNGVFYVFIMEFIIGMLSFEIFLWKREGFEIYSGVYFSLEDSFLFERVCCYIFSF